MVALDLCASYLTLSVSAMHFRVTFYTIVFAAALTTTL